MLLEDMASLYEFSEKNRTYTRLWQFPSTKFLSSPITIFPDYFAENVKQSFYHASKAGVPLHLPSIAYALCERRQNNIGKMASRVRRGRWERDKRTKEKKNRENSRTSVQRSRVFALALQCGGRTSCDACVVHTRRLRCVRACVRACMNARAGISDAYKCAPSVSRPRCFHTIRPYQRRARTPLVRIMRVSPSSPLLPLRAPVTSSCAYWHRRPPGAHCVLVISALPSLSFTPRITRFSSFACTRAVLSFSIYYVSLSLVISTDYPFPLPCCCI